MHQSVRDAWHSFSEPLEGREYGMYLDVFGLVTCGVGNLIDTVSEAQKLPWKRDSDGELATADEVRAAWHALKARQDLRTRSAKHARILTGLHLNDADIDELVARKLESNAAHITRWLPSFPTIPADAQLAILSMAWAVGPAFNLKFPTFTRAALAGDWFAAQAACKIREVSADGKTPNPGVIPRNKANFICFGNAHLVATNGLDPTDLHWPAAVNYEVADLLRDEAKAQTITEQDRARADAAFVEMTRDMGPSTRDLDGDSDAPPPLDTADTDPAELTPDSWRPRS